QLPPGSGRFVGRLMKIDHVQIPRSRTRVLVVNWVSPAKIIRPVMRAGRPSRAVTEQENLLETRGVVRMSFVQRPSAALYASYEQIRRLLKRAIGGCAEKAGTAADAAAITRPSAARRPTTST